MKIKQSMLCNSAVREFFTALRIRLKESLNNHKAVPEVTMKVERPVNDHTAFRPTIKSKIENNPKEL